MTDTFPDANHAGDDEEEQGAGSAPTVVAPIAERFAGWESCGATQQQKELVCDLLRLNRHLQIPHQLIAQNFGGYQLERAVVLVENEDDDFVE